jgi:hypothetical protein
MFRRSQAVVEFALILPALLLLLVGGLVFLDVYSRIERIHFSTAVAARAAATVPGGTGLRDAATSAARASLAGSFPQDSIRVSVSTDSCSLEDRIDVEVEVRWTSPNIPFYGTIDIPLKSRRSSVCEHPG